MMKETLRAEVVRRTYVQGMKPSDSRTAMRGALSFLSRGITLLKKEPPMRTLLRACIALFSLLVLPSHAFSQNSANYSFGTSALASLTDMTAGTVLLIGPSQDDEASALMNLEFPFAFMGNAYSVFSVTSNGLLVLGDDAGPFDYAIGDSGVAAIAPFVSDLATASNGKVHFKVTGTSPNRVLVVEWFNMRIPYNAAAATGSFQVRLSEGSGQIEFIYGSMSSAYTLTGASIGFSIRSTDNSFSSVLASSHTRTTTGTFAVNDFAAGVINALSSTADGSRRSYSFTPPAAPAAPASLTFDEITSRSLRLRWTDNATNESGYIVERSEDGIAYTVVAVLPPNATQCAVSGLTIGTSYAWKVSAFGEGAVSTPVTGIQATSAGTLSGTKTIGATGADYATVSAAIADIQTQGLNGNLSLELQANYDPAGETFPLVFSEMNTASSRKITLRPAAAVTGVSLAASTYGAIWFDNIGHIIIDGRPGGTGSTSVMTVGTPTMDAAALRFRNDASHNTVRYITATASNSSTDNGLVWFEGTAGVTGNDDNLIEHCTLIGGPNRSTTIVYSVGEAGDSTSFNSGNVISQCNIANFAQNGYNSYGIYLGEGNTRWTIKENRLYQESTLSYWSVMFGDRHEAISVNSPSGRDFIVEANTVGFANAQGTGMYTINSSAALRFIGIRINATSSRIDGNTISGFSFKSTSGWFGISVVSGNVQIGTQQGNTVGSGTNTDVILLTGPGPAYGINATSAQGGTIENNQIGGITGDNGQTAGGGIVGITIAGTGANYLIRGNTVGSATQDSSIRGGFVGSTGSWSTVGITSTATGTVSIVSNTIMNHLVNGTGFSGQMLGINSTAGTAEITDNIITKLRTASGATSDASSASIIGMSLTSTTGAGHSIARNKIFDLSNSSTNTGTAVVGLFFRGPASVSSRISRNAIHSLWSEDANSGANLTGMRLDGGSVIVDNNMVRLGIAATGTAITKSQAIFGLYKTSTGNVSALFNSIFIGGTGVGATATSTYGLVLTSSGTDDIRNNIIVNDRSNATTGGKHFSLWFNNSVSTTGVTCDYNVLRAGGTGGVLVYRGLDYTTLPAWQSASGWDLHSAAGNPGFVRPGGSASDVDLHLTGATPAEGSGVVIAAITEDFDGETRNALTPTDIGADAGNFIFVDVAAPVIQFTPLSNGGTNNRTLEHYAVIMDNAGVSTGVNRPRLYYKKSTDANAFVGNASANNGWKYVLSSNDASPYSFTIDYSIINGGSVAVGNVIQYFVVAQDDANNLSSLPTGAGAAASPPIQNINLKATTVYSFTIRAYMSGTYTVPGSYASLTTTSGLFQALANSVLQGDIVVNVSGDVLDENGSYVLPALAEDAPVPRFTLTIQPADATEKLIAGAILNGIRMSGTQRVTIDGSYGGGGRYLRFRNTSTSSPVFQFVNDASGNVIRNCIIEASQNSYGAVYFNTGTVSGNDSNIIESNIIRDRSDAASSPSSLIYAGGSTGALRNSGNVIRNNELSNFTGSAINITSQTTYPNDALNENWTIVGNEIFQSAAGSGTVNGILINALGRNLISQNIIRNLSTTSTGSGVSGIQADMVSDLDIRGNRIYGFSAADGSTLYGMFLKSSSGGPIDRKFFVANNEIAIAPASSSNTIYGLYESGNTGDSLAAYYNSVYLGGVETGARNSFGIFRYSSSTSHTATQVRNNCIVNVRSGGTGQKHAVGLEYKNLFDADYNFLSGSGSGGANYFRIGSTLYDFAGWKTQIAGDTHSWTEAAVSITPPNLFQDVSAGNLQIRADQSEAWYVNGKGMALSGAGLGDERSAAGTRSQTTGIATDIGADEFTPDAGILPPPVTLTGPFTQGTPYDLTLLGRLLGRITFTSATIPASLSVRYFSGTNPPNAVREYANGHYTFEGTGTTTGLDYSLAMVFDPREQNNIPTIPDLRLALTALPSAGWTVYQQSAVAVGPPATVTAEHLNLLGFVTFTSAGAPLHADEVRAIPDRPALHQNYPNPFNPSTVIRYQVPKLSEVDLRVYDVVGREVAVLQHGTAVAGVHAVTWNAESNASGIYFCILRTGSFKETRKLLLVR